MHILKALSLLDPVKWYGESVKGSNSSTEACESDYDMKSLMPAPAPYLSPSISADAGMSGCGGRYRRRWRQKRA
ncbi:Os05g0367600 [Oryza sativa Japonica Group]|uniref:Os05g0367600 protein n=2 Tax=Oryza sativa subsp. japonica TaxID=39947 RepID=B9FP76_ORYSJ|nr:hypothetical protein OsJ_18272 [Oryza sativa Japonica Group]BAS93655.1 Os05g0367600 [Oryza sativa Japonica Group]